MYDNIRFSIKTFSILSFEGIKYLFHRNYDSLIKNISIKLAKENMFYVKFLQAFSTNHNFLSKELIDFLLSYTDNVEFNKKQIDYGFCSSIINVNKKYPHLEIDVNELRVINSGLIAVVFKGKMKNKNVVVKVLKNNIKNEMDIAIKRIEFLINIFKYLPVFKTLNISEIFQENKTIMQEQINFISEINNIKDFGNRFKNIDDIIIPNVYDEFTNYDNNIIVMDYINGRKINQINDYEKDDYGLLLAKFGAKCILYDGIYHGDMHPGNIIFINENDKLKVGIIDFGIVGRLSREEQNCFYVFFSNLLSENFKQASQVILDMLTETSNFDIVLSDNDREKILEKLNNICEHALLTKHNFDASDILKINEVLNKHDLKLSRFFCRLELALAISDSVSQTLSHKRTYIDNLQIAMKTFCPDFL